MSPRCQRFFGVTLMILLCFSYFAPCEAQTKNETVDWLTSKIPKDPFVFDGVISKTSQKMKIECDGSFEIIQSYYEMPLKYPLPDIETTVTITGSFKDFNPNSINIITQGSLLFISLISTNNKECLKISVTGKAGITNVKNGVAFGAFDGSETNIAARLKAAFKHLILLCGRKNEVF